MSNHSPGRFECHTQEAEILRRRPDGKTSAGNGREAQETARTNYPDRGQSPVMAANSDPVRPENITRRVGGGARRNRTDDLLTKQTASCGAPLSSSARSSVNLF